MSVRPRRWLIALLLLVFTTGTMQAAGASPHRGHGDVPAMATGEAHAGHAQAMVSAGHHDGADCADDLPGMSANDCAAFCLTAVPLPALVRLDAPEAPALPTPALDVAGTGWSPPGDRDPPRTSSIG